MVLQCRVVKGRLLGAVHTVDEIAIKALDGFDGGFVDFAEMAVDPGELEAVKWGALQCREGEEVEPENNSQEGTSYPTLGP